MSGVPGYFISGHCRVVNSTLVSLSFNRSVMATGDLVIFNFIEDLVDMRTIENWLNRAGSKEMYV